MMVSLTSVAVCISAILVLKEVLGNANGPKFRILAPQFICPKDEFTPVDKPDNTVISIQTEAGADFDITWNVRWTPLPSPSQRFTIMLWRTVRALQAKLNSPQAVPFVYVIENDEGVEYVFTVNAVQGNGVMGTPKSFRIDNTHGDQKLDMIEGRADLLSVILVGGQVGYADMMFVLEAQVTACFHTQDYFFKWTVRSTKFDQNVDVSAITGSRLEIPPYSLTAGLTYYANCEVYKYSNGYLLTQECRHFSLLKCDRSNPFVTDLHYTAKIRTVASGSTIPTGLHFEVLHRDLEVYLSFDYLMVPRDQPFALETYVINHDNFEHSLLFNFDCTSMHKDEDCDFLTSSNNGTMLFPDGLPKGQYTVSVTVSVNGQSAAAKSTIVTVEHTLPVLHIVPLSRILNEGSTISLVANASNVAPTCSLAWYFATEEDLSIEFAANETCDGCQHGEPLADALTIFSLEENFLNELTDFTNETEWRHVSAVMPAALGRARLVAQCGCSITFECETEGSVHADLKFQLNESPKAGEVMVSPKSGSALETVFRVSTLAVVDPDTPLRYSFYCNVGANHTLMLASYLDHLAVETSLPYVEGGTQIWVKICDALGACSTGDPTTVKLSAGDGSTINLLIDDARAHVRRCEIPCLWRLAGSAVVTYTHAGQPEALSRFIATLLEVLPSMEEICKENNYNQLSSFLHWLASVGVDTSGLLAYINTNLTN